MPPSHRVSFRDELMGPPEKILTDAEVDQIYGLEPAIGNESCSRGQSAPQRSSSWFTCPYCGEPFETSADASAGPCKYVEDCQVCCQPIEMELLVDENGAFAELLTRRGDS